MDPRQPVLIGVGQITDLQTPPLSARAPLDLMRDAALAAARDAGLPATTLARLDSVAVVRSFADSIPRFRSPFGTPVHAPWSLARRLQADQATDLHYGPVGGDTPQRLVARACQRIADGASELALVAGAEALRTELAARRAGIARDWHEDAPEAPLAPAREAPLYSAAEEAHGMRSALAMYALIGQVVRAAAAQGPDAYRHASAVLMARFAAVAHDNPLAAQRRAWTAAELATPTDDNPYVASPYTKRLVASAYTDQSAAVLVASRRLADALGAPPQRRVYLAGAAHAHDTWLVSERAALHRAPALRAAADAALAQAGLDLSRIDFLDLYSCFPSAVQIACAELGLAADDPRSLTVTGGLPYFGGPGNNYVLHAIAETVQRVRRRPGSAGLVAANGGLMTKQAAGVYTQRPPERPAPRELDPALRVDAPAALRLCERPAGAASIETWTVLHDRNGPVQGLLFGRLRATGERFLARTASDAATLQRLQRGDALGRAGQVRQQDGCNLFDADPP